MSNLAAARKQKALCLDRILITSECLQNASGFKSNKVPKLLGVHIPRCF